MAGEFFSVGGADPTDIISSGVGFGYPALGVGTQSDPANGFGYPAFGVAGGGSLGPTTAWGQPSGSADSYATSDPGSSSPFGGDAGTAPQASAPAGNGAVSAPDLGNGAGGTFSAGNTGSAGSDIMAQANYGGFGGGNQINGSLSQLGFPAYGVGPTLFTNPADFSSNTVADAIYRAESGAGETASRQPKSMVNPYYGQYPDFVKQYGSGAPGVYNYANQFLGANPAATIGDLYAGYVLGTGGPGGSRFSNLQTTRVPGAQGAAANFTANSGFNPSTPLASALAGSQGNTSYIASFGDPASVAAGYYGGGVTPAAPAMAAATPGSQAGNYSASQAGSYRAR